MVTSASEATETQTYKSQDELEVTVDDVYSEKPSSAAQHAYFRALKNKRRHDVPSAAMLVRWTPRSLMNLKARVTFCRTAKKGNRISPSCAGRQGPAFPPNAPLPSELESSGSRYTSLASYPP